MQDIPPDLGPQSGMVDVFIRWTYTEETCPLGKLTRDPAAAYWSFEGMGSIC